MSEKHPSVRCIAVSHSSAEHTERWIPEVGGTWNVEVVIDEERQIYADWGLGNSSIWHFANPRVLYSVYKLGTGEGIWNRPADTGTRYQTAGAFGVDRLGNVVWGHVSSEADDLPNFDEAIRSLDA